MSGRGKFKWQHSVALGFLAAMTVLVILQRDIYFTVFFGVMALWWQQQAIYKS